MTALRLIAPFVGVFAVIPTTLAAPIERILTTGFETPATVACPVLPPQTTGRYPLLFPGDDTFEIGAGAQEFFPKGEDPLAALRFQNCNLQIRQSFFSSNASLLREEDEFRVYDTLGRIVEERQDLNADGDIDVSVYYSYNSAGDLQLVRTDADGDDQLDREDRYTYVYDINQRIEQMQAAFDDDLDAGDGAPSSASGSFLYDSAGRFQQEIWSVVQIGLTTQFVGTYAYDAAGNIAAYTRDYTGSAPTKRFEFAFNADRRLVEFDSATLHPATGVVLANTAYDFVYPSTCQMSQRLLDTNTLTPDGVDSTLGVEYDEAGLIDWQDEVPTEPDLDGCPLRIEWLWRDAGRPQSALYDGADYSDDGSQPCTPLNGRADRILSFSGTCVN